ncbi:MAG: lysylphosphatidylglycerol synthase transmembrane domain-containing protein [Thermofilaceae archaeon]
MPRVSGKAGYMLGLVIGIAILAIIVILSDPATVAWRIAKAKLVYVALACIFDFASIIFYSLAWVLAARAVEVGINLTDGLIASILGLFADKLVASASASGEIVRLAYIKSRNSEVNYTDLLATIMIHRFLYNIAFIALLAIASTDLVLRGDLPHMLIFLVILAIISTLIASYLTLKPETLKGVARATGSFAERIAVRFLSERKLNLAAKAEELVEGLSISVKKAAGRKIYMSLAAMLMLAQWIAGAFEFSVLFTAIGQGISFWVSLVIFPLHCFLTALPVGLPAAVGVTEAGTLLGLIAFGVDRPSAMAVTLLVRFVEVWFETLLGVTVATLVGVFQYEARVFEWIRRLTSSGDSSG